jgi:hypothetical protein
LLGSYGKPFQTLFLPCAHYSLEEKEYFCFSRYKQGSVRIIYPLTKTERIEAWYIKILNVHLINKYDDSPRNISYLESIRQWLHSTSHRVNVSKMLHHPWPWPCLFSYCIVLGKSHLSSQDTTFLIPSHSTAPLNTLAEDIRGEEIFW